MGLAAYLRAAGQAADANWILMKAHFQVRAGAPQLGLEGLAWRRRRARGPSPRSLGWWVPRRRTTHALGCCWSRPRTACWLSRARTLASLHSTRCLRDCATTFATRRGWHCGRTGARFGWHTGRLVAGWWLFAWRGMSAVAHSVRGSQLLRVSCVPSLQAGAGCVWRAPVGAHRGASARRAGQAVPAGWGRSRSRSPLCGHAALPPQLACQPEGKHGAISGRAAEGCRAGARGGGRHVGSGWGTAEPALVRHELSC